MNNFNYFINKLLIMVFLHMIVHLSAYAKQPDERITINSEVMSPYNFMSNTGEIKGINVDIVKTIFKNLGINYTFNLYPWPRAFNNTLTNENHGLISTTYTKQRADLFKWVGPLASGKGYLYKLKSRKDIQLKKIDDAKNYTVAVVRGGVDQTYFEKLGFEVGKNLMLFSYNEEYIKPFLLGKVDLILASSIVLPYLLKELDTDIDLLKPEGEMIYTVGNFLALHKSTPDEMVKKLNKALQKLKDSGEYQKIIDSYDLKKKKRKASFQ